MFILIPAVLFFQDAPPLQEATAEMSVLAGKKCAPEIDPATGVMYPMCAPSVKSRYDFQSLDITTDAYERAAKLARKEGVITREQLSEKMGRVREARDLHDKLSGDF